MTFRELSCDAGVLGGIALTACGIARISEAWSLVFIGIALAFISIKVATR